MKVLLLAAGGRAGSDLFHSLLDEHSQILQFPGKLRIDRNFLDLINLKNLYSFQAFQEIEVFGNVHQEDYETNLNLLFHQLLRVKLS